jgi:hypothetical protein
MPKLNAEHEESVHLRCPAVDKRAFQEAASRMRISLSAWLRLAGLEKIERENLPSRPQQKSGRQARSR